MGQRFDTMVILLMGAEQDSAIAMERKKVNVAMIS